MIERAAKSGTEGYPPYNIEQTRDDGLRITLAVAGFTAGDLNITVEDNQLVIRGRQTDDKERVYLHRGIAARQFQRSEEHTSELQSREKLVCRLLLEKKNDHTKKHTGIQLS